MKTRSINIAALGATAFILAACGGGGVGGDTTCGDFVAMAKDDQSSVISDFLASKGESSPSNGKISLTRVSAIAFCKTAGNDDSHISEIDG